MRATSLAAKRFSFRETDCHQTYKKMGDSSLFRQSPSAVVHEERETNSGVFTSYKDGRVKVRFWNRILLAIDEEGRNCEAILASGKRLFISVGNPLGLEEYVKKAMRFRSWTFSSLSHQREILDAMSNIEAEGRKCRINAAFYMWTADKSFKCIVLT